MRQMCSRFGAFILLLRATGARSERIYSEAPGPVRSRGFFLLVDATSRALIEDDAKPASERKKNGIK